MSLVRVMAFSVWVAVFTEMASSKEGPLKIQFAEEGSNITLGCPSTSMGLSRFWYTGIHNILQHFIPNQVNEELLFHQTPSGSLQKVTKRDDVALDDVDFGLTIINLEKIKHSIFYTCVTNHSDEATIDIIRVQVYEAPANVTVIHVVEGDNVTIECPSTVSGVARGWHRGASQDNTPYIMINQTANGHVFSTNAFASNFTVDSDSFALMYTNIQFHDRGYYKCITHIPGKNTFTNVFINVYRPVEVKEIEEFTTVILPADTPVIATWTARWNHGRIGVIYLGTPTLKIPTQNRQDMSLAGNSFNLRIMSVRLEDDTFISCVTETGSSLIDSASIYRLQVYIQPSIIGLFEIDFNETDTVTMGCSIHRIYPQLASSDFQMTWGDMVQQPVASANSDGSWTYTVSITKELTAEDDKSTINCTVTPRRGRATSRVEIINVLSTKTTTTATTTTKAATTTTKAAKTTTPIQSAAETTTTTLRKKPVKGSGSQEATKEAAETSLVPIIGGVIGAVVLLLLVILIAVFCVRKRGNKGSVPNKGISTQNEYTNPAFHENDDLKSDL